MTPPQSAAADVVSAVFAGGPLDGTRVPKGGVGQWASYRDPNGHSVWAAHGDARLRAGQRLYVLRDRDHDDHVARLGVDTSDRLYVWSELTPVPPPPPAPSTAKPRKRTR